MHRRRPRSRETVEYCQLIVADGVTLLEEKLFPNGLPADWRRGPGVVFEMRFSGRVLERGRFGHMGRCCWRLLVSEWIDVRRKEGR